MPVFSPYSTMFQKLATLSLLKLYGKTTFNAKSIDSIEEIDGEEFVCVPGNSIFTSPFTRDKF